jgi:hypothetical protein
MPALPQQRSASAFDESVRGCAEQLAWRGFDFLAVQQVAGVLVGDAQWEGLFRRAYTQFDKEFETSRTFVAKA